jgi:hypothetical protein
MIPNTGRSESAMEKRGRIRLIKLPDHFPSELREVLEGRIVCPLSDDQVHAHGNNARGGAENFLVPMGNFVQLCKDAIPAGADISFLDAEGPFVFLAAGYAEWIADE